MIKSDKFVTIMLAAAWVGSSGCVHETPMQAMQTLDCGVLADPPAPLPAAIDNANCPNSTEVYLSAVFKNGKPAGVGGGVNAGTGSKSDKKVKGGQNICWVATNESGGLSGQKFDILFSPSEKPVPNQNYQSINIFPAQDMPETRIEFKYTVWAGKGECEYFDPRFVIN